MGNSSTYRRRSDQTGGLTATHLKGGGSGTPAKPKTRQAKTKHGSAGRHNKRTSIKP
jgi:hypothetical protein